MLLVERQEGHQSCTKILPQQYSEGSPLEVFVEPSLTWSNLEKDEPVKQKPSQSFLEKPSKTYQTTFQPIHRRRPSVSLRNTVPPSSSSSSSSPCLFRLPPRSWGRRVRSCKLTGHS